MLGKAAGLVRRTGLLLLFLSLPISVPASGQAGDAAISGTVTDPSGKGVPNARVSARSVTTGLAADVQTDPAGLFVLRDLAPGDYDVSVSAAGFPTRVSRVTLAAASRETLNVALSGGFSLGDLGFSSAEIQGSAAAQARLDKRSYMLKMHQRFGLLAAVPMLATVITGSGAGGRSTSSSGRTVHAVLGSLTVGLYGTSVYYAIFAPKIEGTPTHGKIRLHKALAWVHGAGMILTPVLGGIAYDQRSRGEKVHGIASAHGAVAITTAVAYGLAIFTETLK